MVTKPSVLAAALTALHKRQLEESTPAAMA
jgi:hypothetical protein